MNADIVMFFIDLTPSPPNLTGREACFHFASSMSIIDFFPTQFLEQHRRFRGFHNHINGRILRKIVTWG